MKRSLLLVLFVFFIVLRNVSAFQVKSSVIHGIVTDESGKPLAGAGVTIENSFLGVITDKDGAYAFNDLKDGVYNLSFSFIGYESQIHEVKLTENSVLNISLIPKPLLAGEVIMRPGQVFTPLLLILL
jgi:hypothetical protein